MQVSLDNHKLLDDNLKLNKLNVDLEKMIYSLNIENDGMKSKMKLFDEFKSQNREMKDEITTQKAKTTQLNTEIQDLKMRLRRAKEGYDQQLMDLGKEKSDIQSDYERLMRDFNG
jgi:uncharacterized coiled-coil DUF342 family protein